MGNKKAEAEQFVAGSLHTSSTRQKADRLLVLFQHSDLGIPNAYAVQHGDKRMSS
jgi:hypothetical protein